jgi:Transposase
VHNSGEQVQDDNLLTERRIGSWSGEQGVKKKWNAFLKTAKSVANRQTMPRVADMRGNPPVSFGKGATEKGRVIGTSLVPYFILRGWGAGNSILLPDTVMNDAEWIADLLRHGLLRPSFVPSVQERELRELTRHQTRLIEERSRVINRLQKVLGTSEN